MVFSAPNLPERTLAGIAAALATTALAAHLTAFTIAHDPDLWVAVGWSSAGLVALVGVLSAAAASETRRERLAWVFWLLGSLAWLSGVLAHSFDDDLSRASVSWLLAAAFALGGLILHAGSNALTAPLLRTGLPVALVAGAILFLGSSHAEGLGVERELFATEFALPALLLALIVVQLGGRWGLERFGSALFLAWSGLLAAAALSWPEQRADGAIVVWTDPMWAVGLLGLGGYALHRALAPSRPLRTGRAVSGGTGSAILIQGLSILALLVLAFLLRSSGDLLFWWAFIALAAFLVRVYWTSRGAQQNVSQLLAAKEALEQHLARAHLLRAEAERMQEELAKQNAQLRELDRLKDEFLALVSHELRTPLTSIIGYLELVLSDEEAETDTADHRQYLQVVERNAARLLRLVDDLLFVARIEAGTFTFEREEVDLRTIVVDSLEAQRPEARRKEIELVCSVDEVPPLEGDGARLGQLVDNLITNAIKFTPKAGRVAVSLALENGSLGLVVEDSGIGIPASEQPYLFERFFRASSATEHAIRGTGLGLSIAKAIVDAHGGQISCQSEEGLGTTFRVELPLGGSEAGREAWSQAASSPSRSRPSSGSKLI